MSTDQARRTRDLPGRRGFGEGLSVWVTLHDWVTLGHSALKNNSGLGAFISTVYISYGWQMLGVISQSRQSRQSKWLKPCLSGAMLQANGSVKFEFGISGLLKFQAATSLKYRTDSGKFWELCQDQSWR